MKFNAVLLGISFFASKILGLLRDNLLASNFGATNGGMGLFNLDTYYAAFRLPDLLFNLLSYGILSSAFVPIFVEILKKENKTNAFRFSNEILHAVSVTIGVLSAISVILAPFLLRLFVPGFEESNFQITVNLTRIMLITPLFFTIGSVASGIQNSLHKFIGIAMAPIFYNLGILGGIIFFSKDIGVYGVAIGVAIGAFLNMLIQLPGIFKLGFRYEFPKKWWTNRVKEMIFLSIPRIFGMSVTQLSLIIDTVIASTLSIGSITIINFASNLESLPIGLIGVSVAVVSFGTLSAYAAESKSAEFIKEISSNVRKILFLLMPLAFGMAILRIQIVRLLLFRGKFNWTDTILTANTLGIFLIGLIFGGIVFILARAFYALKDTKTPVIASAAAVLMNIACSLFFTKILTLGTYGLAASNAAANIINASLLVIFLTRRFKMPILDIKEIIKFLFSAILMGIVVYIAELSFTRFLGNADTYSKLFIYTVGATFIGAVTYFYSCVLLKCKDAKLRVFKKQ